MKKRLVSLLMAAVLVVSLGTPTNYVKASNGESKEETIEVMQEELQNLEIESKEVKGTSGEGTTGENSSNQTTDTSESKTQSLEVALTTKKLVIYTGQKKSIPLFDEIKSGFKPVALSYDSGDSSILSVSTGNDGEAVCYGKKAGTTAIYVTVSNGSETTTVLCNVTVRKVTYSRGTYAVAKGCSIPTKIFGLYGGDAVKSIHYQSSNTSDVTIDKDGVITGHAYDGNDGCDAFITATIHLASGEELVKKAKVEVTDPVITKDLYCVAKKSKVSLEVETGSSFSMYQSVETSDTKYLKVANCYSGTLMGVKDGKMISVNAVLDGRSIHANVYVSNPQVADYYPAYLVGNTGTFVVTGLSEKYSDKVAFSVDDPSILSCDEDGRFYIRSMGSTKVRTRVDYKDIVINVTVGTKTAVAAYREGEKALGAKYSQPYRMKENYRDCSSFVWRAYSAVGIRMGVSKKVTWAPVAAAQAKYYATKKQVIFTGKQDDSKLRVGDLIFYSYQKNGRYKNIGHVAMYVGNGLIIHASSSGGCVKYAPYSDLQSHIVMAVRPTNT